MIKHIIKVTLCVVLVIFFCVSYDATAMFLKALKTGVGQSSGAAARAAQAVKKTPIPTHPGASRQAPPGMRPELRQGLPASLQSSAHGQVLSSQLPPGQHFPARDVSSRMPTFPAKTTIPETIFPEGQRLQRDILSAMSTGIANQWASVAAEKDIAPAIQDIRDNGFAAFLIPADATTFLGPSNLIPQEGGQWLTHNSSGMVYVASIMLPNGNIIAFTRSIGGELYAVIAESKNINLGDYLNTFYMPQGMQITRKFINNTKTQEAFLKAQRASLESTKKMAELKQQEEQAEPLVESIVPEQQVEIPQPEVAETKPEIVPVTITPLAPKKPMEPISETTSPAKKIVEPVIAKKIISEEVQPPSEAEMRAKEREEEMQASERENIRLEKVLPEIVDAEWEALQKKSAEEEAIENEIGELSKELDSVKQEADALAQGHAQELEKIAQEAEEINAPLVAQLEQLQQKEITLRDEKAELVKNINEKYVAKEKSIQQTERELKEELEKKKNEIEQQNKTDKEKSIQEDKSAQEEINGLTAELEQLKQKKITLSDENAELVKNINENYIAEEKSIQQTEQELKEEFEKKKNEIEQQNKMAKEKSIQEEKSAQEEIEKLEGELQDLIEAHKNALSEAKAARLKEMIEETEKKVKEAREKKLNIEIEAARKKAELELITNSATETKKIAEQAAKDVDLKKIEQQELEELVKKAEQETTQIKEELSEKQKEELILKEDENKKIEEIEQEKLKQEVANKEIIRLEAEKKAEEALAKQQEAEAALKRLEAEKKIAEEKIQNGQQKLEEIQNKKEPLHKKIEKQVQPTMYVPHVSREEESVVPEFQKTPPFSITPTPTIAYEKPIELKKPIIEPVELSAPLPKEKAYPSSPLPLQAPATLTENPVLRDEQVPKPILYVPLQPSVQIPATVTENPILPSEPAPKEPVHIPSQVPLQVPEEAPVQALPEEKKPSKRKPTSRVFETTQYSKSPAQSVESPTTKEPSGRPASVDMDPLLLTPFNPRPHPDIHHPTHIPYLPPKTSSSYAPPMPSYNPMGSSYSSDVTPIEQPQAYLPAIKSQLQQAMFKKIKLRQKAKEFLEKLLPFKKSMNVEQQISDNKELGLLLRLFRQKRAQAQDTRNRKKIEVSQKESDIITKKEKPAHKPISFVQKITTTIQDAVTAVIDTIGTYINRLFSVQ